MSIKALQDYTYFSRYARYNAEEKRRETWNEAVDRVKGMHLRRYPQVEEEIEWAFDLVKQKKVLGSQRALQFGGIPIEKKHARIYNCTVSFCDRIRFFQESFWLLLCGSGVGFSVQTHHIDKLPDFYNGKYGRKKKRTYLVPDTIEGWADALGILLATYLPNADFSDWAGCTVEFDYSAIRPAGSHLASGVGKAPGPDPLKRSLEVIRELLDRCLADKQKRLRSIDAYDLIMHASDAVLSGGVRRSATICIFSPHDEDMVKAKTGNWLIENPQRGRSNNSALLLRDKTTKEDFMRLIESVKEFGEPGFFWSDSTEQLPNPCFHKDTRLATHNGLRRIEDLYRSGKSNEVVTDCRVGKGDHLNLDDKGVKSLPATKVALTQKNADIYEVVTTHGHSIKVTLNHEFPTTRGRLPLHEMVVGDTILLQSDEGKWGNFGTFEQGMILGLITGDGTFSTKQRNNKEHHEAFIDVWESDFDQLEYIQSIVNEEICKLPSISNGGRMYGCLEWVDQTPGENDDKKRIGGGRLYRFLKEVLKIDSPRSIKQSVSECVWSGSREFVQGYLQGFFFADGGPQLSGYKKSATLSYRLNQSNRKLLGETQVLLNNFGIVSSIASRRKAGYRLLPDGKGGRKEYFCKENFDLIINRPNAIAFDEKISWFGKKKLLCESFWEIRGKDCRKPERFITKIKSIEYHSTDDVFCLTQKETNSVIAMGCVVGQCVEIGMWPVHWKTKKTGWSFCNLTEINGKKVKCKEDFAIAARAGAIVGTLQAGYTDFDYLGQTTKEIVEREALLGVSITGMMDSPDILFDPKIQREIAKLVVKTNEWMAKKIGIRAAARCTCVKPAGCQKAGTLISTKNGIFRLDELGNVNGKTWQKMNQLVYTDKNKQNATQFYVNGEAKTKKILLDSGLELESTFNHRFRVLEDGKYIWKNAENLKEGDLLPYSLGEYKNTKYQKLINIKFEKNSRATRLIPIFQPKILDENLAWLLGLYFADGSNHTKGIRFAGNSIERKGFDKAIAIIKDKFGRCATENEDNREGNRTSLNLNSIEIIPWLEANQIKKQKAEYVRIPLKIRMSPPSVIKAFIEGYLTGDGCEKSPTPSFATTSKRMAEELVVVLRAIGMDCKFRLMPPTKDSWGEKMRYWIQIRKSRSGQRNKNRLYIREAWNNLDDHGFTKMSVDTVKAVSEGKCKTYDIEVKETHTYLANSYISHNTTSCILGSASGVHPHHAKRYFRRVQGNALEHVLQHFKKFNAHAVEKSVWSANDTDEIVTFCIEVPDGAKTKNNLNAIELLNHVKSTQQNWVTSGKVTSRCTKKWLSHNVSNTINVRPEEWDDVSKFIWNNRKWFAGISILPQSGDLDYPQAPMCNILTAREILQRYGDGALLASGLIVDGIHAFDDLWVACDAVLGMGEPVEKPERPGNGSIRIDAARDWEEDCKIYERKIDWVRRVKQFAERYVDNDAKECCYLLKHAHNWKLWLDLQREYKDVDYTQLIEEEDFTKPMETISCAGGACEVI